MYRNICYKINKQGPKWQGEIVLYTWDEKGNRVTRTFPHNSHLYYEDSRGNHESIYGTLLKKEEFMTSMDRKRYVERNPEKKYFGANKPIREFLRNEYGDINETPEFSKYPLRVHYFDLEIAVEDEFPDPYLAKYPINLITIYDTMLCKYFTWAMPSKQEIITLDRNDVVLEVFTDEKDLLDSYMKWHSKNYPDVMSGWNSMFFDMPYLVNRLRKVCDEDTCAKLSPVGSIYESVKMQKTKKMRCYNIDGITHLDYLFLYRDKFPPEERRFSYSLGTIGELETGKGKFTFNGSLKEFYINDFSNFVKYNIRDTEILKELDEKLMLIMLSRAICNLGLCEYEAIYSSIPYLYGSLEVDEMRRTGKLYPSNIGKEATEKLEKYQGAFVKTVEGKMYTRGVASIDLNSLYPNITIALNLSPETKFGKIIGKTEDKHCRIKLRNGDEKFFDEKQMQFLLEKKCTLSSNNVMYLKPELKKGSVPTFLERIYEKRKTVRKEMNKIDKKISELKEEKENATPEKIKSIINQIHKYEHNSHRLFIEQVSYKNVLNSIYGMIGSRYSAIFDVDNAEAITLTGQFIIKEASDFIDATFKKRYNIDTTDYRYDVYNDTDSIIGNTLLRTNIGIIPIEFLFNSSFKDNTKEAFISKYGHEIVPIKQNINIASLNDLEKNEISFNKIKNIIRHKVSKKKYIIKAGGKEIIMTEDHGCMIYREGKNLRISPKDINIKTDKCFYMENNMKYELINIDSIECLGNFNDEYVYDLEMESEPHVFFANDILIHNSTYFDCSLIVNSIIGKDAEFNKGNIRKICVEVDRFVKDEVNKFCFEEIVKKKLYSTLDRIEFKREAFASSAIFLTKKRYVLHVKNNEGTDVDKFKYVGVEVKKKEIPPMVSDMLKIVIENLMDRKWTTEIAKKNVCEMWEKFRLFKPEEMAYYKNLTKAKRDAGFLEAEHGSQVHARAAIYHNQLIDKLGLKGKYAEIMQGDRMRYVWLATNSFNIDCIAFKEEYPEEFRDLFVVDYEVCFHKMFLRPISPFLELSHVGKFDPRNNDIQDIMLL